MNNTPRVSASSDDKRVAPPAPAFTASNDTRTSHHDRADITLSPQTSPSNAPCSTPAT